MHLRRATTAAALAAAVAPVLLLAAGPARADATPDPGDPTTLPGCSEVSSAHNNYQQDSLRAGEQGVPNRVVAGDGWHTVTGTLHNIGHTTLPVVVADSTAFRDSETTGDPGLGPYVLVEVQSDSGTWARLGDGSEGRVGTLHDLAPGATGTFHLRFRISADAPRTETYGMLSFGGTFSERYTYPDTGKTVDCAGNDNVTATFAIKPAGSTAQPTTSPTAAPTTSPTAAPSGSPSATPTTVPSGTATTSAPGSQLAATGSGTTMPLLAGLGAAAIAAGTVALGRRRRAHR